MTRAVYLIGGAGCGKSAFMDSMLVDLGAMLGPLEDIATAPNSKGTTITLRGHRWEGGVYLGCMRTVHPGTDGLDRVSSVAAVGWAAEGDLPAMIIGEGLTLAHQVFLTELGKRSELLVVHLTASPGEVRRRCEERGSQQAETFLKNTTTRAANLAAALTCPVLSCDTEDEEVWDLCLDIALSHLEGGSVITGPRY